MSVIVAPIQSGFQLSSLGSPQKAGERFLNTTIAPEGSGLEANLISATQRCFPQPSCLCQCLAVNLKTSLRKSQNKNVAVCRTTASHNRRAGGHVPVTHF